VELRLFYNFGRPGLAATDAIVNFPNLPLAKGAEFFNVGA
jgi:hypothetical protein